MNFFTKTLSVGLSAVLVASVMPLSAFAEDKTDMRNNCFETSDKTETIAKTKSIVLLKQPSEDAADNAEDKEINEKVGSILSSGLLPDALLEKIADIGVEFVLKHIIDVQFDTDFGSPKGTEDKILDIVQEMKEQVNKIERTTDQTYIRVKQAALETPLNNFIKELSVVKNDCFDLANLYQNAVSIEDKTQRTEAIERFKLNNLERLRNLASRLNTLFDSASIVIQGRGNQDIISVYDQLMAESYNFANGVPFEQRQQFRNSIASTWIFGALIVSVLDQGSTAGLYSMQMEHLYNNGEQLNKLINIDHKLELSDVEKFDKDGARIVYCYTLDRFVRLTDGDEHDGWRHALRSTYNKVHLPRDSEYARYNIGTWHEDAVVSPFGIFWSINWNSENEIEPFGKFYASSDQLHSIYNKIPDGMTLVDEFIAHRLLTKENNDSLYNIKEKVMAGSMVGGERFVHNGWNDTHRWYMNVVPVVFGKNAPHAYEELVFKSAYSLFDSTWQFYIFTLKDPELLFALEFK